MAVSRIFLLCAEKTHIIEDDPTINASDVSRKWIQRHSTSVLIPPSVSKFLTVQLHSTVSEKKNYAQIFENEQQFSSYVLSVILGMFTHGMRNSFF